MAKTTPDRRQPARQQPIVNGDRTEDPKDRSWLKPRDCADRIGVTPNFIIGEIREGRLAALVIERPGAKTIYRICESNLEAYISKYQWLPIAAR